MAIISQRRARGQAHESLAELRRRFSSDSAQPSRQALTPTPPFPLPLRQPPAGADPTRPPVRWPYSWDADPHTGIVPYKDLPIEVVCHIEHAVAEFKALTGSYPTLAEIHITLSAEF